MKNTSPSPSSFYTPDNYRPQGSVAYLMLRNKSSYQRLGDLRLADLGITAAQMSVLLLVSHSEAATISSLSQALGVNAAATVRVVQKLEKMKLIQKGRTGNWPVAHCCRKEGGNIDSTTVVQSIKSVIKWLYAKRI